MSEPPDEFVEFAKAAFEHRECRGMAELHAVKLGLEATVAPNRPGVGSVVCRHGVRYWLVPGVKDGTP